MSPGAGRPYAGRALAARRSDQRERILLAARDVFAHSGFAQGSVEEIVTAARVSRSTFYAFFANKEECLLAVHALGVERIAAAVGRAVGQLEPAGLEPGLIRAGVRAAVEALAADAALARIMLIEVAGATRRAEQAHARARAEVGLLIERRLEHEPYWREQTEQHRHVAAIATIAAITAPISEILVLDRIDEWRTLVEPVTRFVCGALLDPERERGKR